MQLNNAHVLVTGANRGLGKALVEQLLEAGASRVYAAARDLQQVNATDPRILPVCLDVTDPASVAALAASIERLDLVINNAGVIAFGDILQVSEESLDHCLDVNLKGLWRVARAFVPHLERSGQGALCNVLTVLSLASMPGLSAYNLSKAAAWSAHLSLRASLQGKNIAVQAAFPSAIDTDMIADVPIEKDTPELVASNIIRGIGSGEEDIFPMPMAQAVYDQWRVDHKAVERQFASM
ncbi:SDR family NAD(P)-dependent oxidoreductase [Marinimicrobium sp. ABcell2]|uniref:SDR family NAD(P)-dependent oxidoreductase n=1 Tax=Marinimicrobium sp. ABcell2 TaxID=3069751 RepID=UPI0027B714E0|nr:SDR family NAD(P)-dependent oxidoreductase [Marinimicrobium sp. ABcell2]MDQ2077980.1 SDR family NAD(P)-dependent oxidoreductase [Marinimicrobium sp. ABcell2]